MMKIIDKLLDMQYHVYMVHKDCLLYTSDAADD